MPTSGIARHGLSPAGLAARAGRTPHLRRRCGPSSGTLRPPGGGPAGPRRASGGRIGFALAVHTDLVCLKFLPLGILEVRRLNVPYAVPASHMVQYAFRAG